MANRVMEKADTDPAFNSRGWQYWQQEVQLGSCVLPMRFWWSELQYCSRYGNKCVRLTDIQEVVLTEHGN